MSNKIDLYISESMTKNSKTKALYGEFNGVTYPLIYFKKSAYISDETYKELLDKGLSILVNLIPALEKRLKGELEDIREKMKGVKMNPGPKFRVL